MSRVERALPPSRARSLSLSRSLPAPFPTVPIPSLLLLLPHSVSTHSEGFIEIYSRLRLHVYDTGYCEHV